MPIEALPFLCKLLPSRASGSGLPVLTKKNHPNEEPAFLCIHAPSRASGSGLFYVRKRTLPRRRTGTSLRPSPFESLRERHIFARHTTCTATRSLRLSKCRRSFAYCSLRLVRHAHQPRLRERITGVSKKNLPQQRTGTSLANKPLREPQGADCLW